MKPLIGLLASLFLLPPLADARITYIVIDRAESPAFGGNSFGSAGTYEKIVGRAFGEVDPNDPLNAVITDIDKAPRNVRGRVEYQTEFYLLKPVDPTGGNGGLFYSGLNRGMKINFPTFNIGASATPDPESAGDGFMLKRGYVYLWSAWQADVLPGAGRMRFTAPVATDAGAPITGRLRTEYRVVAPLTTQNLSGSASASSYATASLDKATARLTRRVHASDAREIVPPERWEFADCSTTPFPGVPSTTKLCLLDGFDPNYIYEFIYEAKNPLVLGLGFAGTRDLISFLRHAAADDAGTPNPVAGAVRFAIAEGASQPGAYLISFLQLGFNADEGVRAVFDAVNPHVFTMRLGANIRFGQPDVLPYNYAGSESPFTWGSIHDPVAGRTSGYLRRCAATGTCPKVVHTLSSSEYWRSRVTTGSAGPASLLTTDALARHDVGIPGGVRIYHITGTEHTPAVVPSLGFCQHLNNPSPHRETRRALLVAMERWVTLGEEPPRSCIPTLRSGTLVPVDATSVRWPAVPGLPFPGVVNPLPLLDFGPGFNDEDSSGVITEPVIDLGKSYVVRVPIVDADGNEVAGVRSTTQRAPLGTYTGWNVRRAGFGEGDLCDVRNLGSFIPFKGTRAEREAASDPRPSLEERYGDHAGYVAAVQAGAQELVAEGFLLSEDAARLVSEAEVGSVLR